METRHWSRTDLYAELGVQPGASPQEIDDRYRALAKLFHPDRNPGDELAEERFKRITAANRILGDPYKRADYDNYRRRITEPSRPAFNEPKPIVKRGTGIRKHEVHPAVRVATAIALVVAGIATVVWRIVAPPTDPATELTLWLVAVKLLVVGGVVAVFPTIRDYWFRVSSYG